MSIKDRVSDIFDESVEGKIAITQEQGKTNLLAGLTFDWVEFIEELVKELPGNIGSIVAVYVSNNKVALGRILDKVLRRRVARSFSFGVVDGSVQDAAKQVVEDTEAVEFKEPGEYDTAPDTIPEEQGIAHE